MLILRKFLKVKNAKGPRDPQHLETTTDTLSVIKSITFLYLSHFIKINYE